MFFNKTLKIVDKYMDQCFKHLENQHKALEAQNKNIEKFISRVNNIEDNLWLTSENLCGSIVRWSEEDKALVIDPASKPLFSDVTFCLNGGNVEMTADYRTNSLIEKQKSIKVHLFSEESKETRYTSECNLTEDEKREFAEKGSIFIDMRDDVEKEDKE